MAEISEKLTEADKARIKKLMRTDEWESLIKYYAAKLAKWQEEKITGTTEFETLRMLHTNQGKVEGLEEFMNQLEQAAYE